MDILPPGRRWKGRHISGQSFSTNLGPKSCWALICFDTSWAWCSFRVVIAHITARIVVHRQLLRCCHHTWAVSRYATIPGYLEIPKVWFSSTVKNTIAPLPIKGDILYHQDLDRAVHQPNQWTEVNVANLSSIDLGGHAHYWYHMGQIFEKACKANHTHTWWHNMSPLTFFATSYDYFFIMMICTLPIFCSRICNFNNNNNNNNKWNLYSA